MELKLVEELKGKTPGYIKKQYETDETVQQKNFCELLKRLEDDSTKFYDCSCSTYNNDGFPISPKFKSIEDLLNKDFDNPDVLFSANFIDRNTDAYKFTVCACVNDNFIDIFHNPKLAPFIKRDVERDKKLEELKKNRAKIKEGIERINSENKKDIERMSEETKKDIEKMNEETRKDIEKINEEVNKDIGGSFHK